jgi:hypothetical protein
MEPMTKSDLICLPSDATPIYHTFSSPFLRWQILRSHPLGTLGSWDCVLTDEIVKGLTRFASNRKNTTSAGSIGKGNSLTSLLSTSPRNVSRNDGGRFRFLRFSTPFPRPCTGWKGRSSSFAMPCAGPNPMAWDVRHHSMLDHVTGYTFCGTHHHVLGSCSRPLHPRPPPRVERQTQPGMVPGYERHLPYCGLPRHSGIRSTCTACLS